MCILPYNYYTMHNLFHTVGSLWWADSFSLPHGHHCPLQSVIWALKFGLPSNRLPIEVKTTPLADKQCLHGTSSHNLSFQAF